MSRSAPRRLRLRFVHPGSGLLALGLMFTFTGCSDGTPRAGSIDLGASKEVGAVPGSIGLPPMASKTRDVSRTRGKWKVGRTLNSNITTPAKTR